MTLTRDQRRTLFTALLLGAWVVFMLLVWGSATTTWRSVGGSGVKEVRVGLLPYVEVTSTDVDALGVRGPTFERTWRWRPARLVLAVLASVYVGLLLLVLQRRLVERYTLVGRCDGCGYALVGLRERRCPECGENVPLRAFATGAATRGRPTPGRGRRLAGHAAVVLAWLLGVGVLWLGGSTTTGVGLPGLDRQVTRTWGLPPYLETVSRIPQDASTPPTRTATLRPGGLVGVIAATAVWSGMVVALVLWSRRHASDEPV